jgi:hypothetical protein
MQNRKSKSFGGLNAQESKNRHVFVQDFKIFQSSQPLGPVPALEAGRQARR